MSAHDISRSAFDPKKHYSSVRMQQGRVIVDDDWNESERIQAEDRRRNRLEIVGAFGTSDKGFLIEKPGMSLDGSIDFEIHPGTFYLGGLRLDMHNSEHFRSQHDWLQQDITMMPLAEGERRFDLAYLEAWEQAVTSVEDQELIEAALGGPDTSGRVRTVRQVHLCTASKPSCDDAWNELRQSWEADGKGEVNDENECWTDAQLTVAVSGAPPIEADLCASSVTGRYLGAENQAIRVQLIDGKHFTWGYDNGSAIYRVVVDADNKTINLLSEPKDEYQQPGTQHIVEILPWTAVLPNGEKLAALSGHLSGISNAAAGEGDTAGKVILKTPLPENFGQAWKKHHNTERLERSSRNDEDGRYPRYMYMRVWDRGPTTNDPSPKIAFQADREIELENTGLTVRFSGKYFRSGDHWIVAVRPETPGVVVPWSFENGRSPNGVKRYFAPLGLIEWQRSGDHITAKVHDCRRRFRPLTRPGSCTTFTVGDSIHSWGDFSSVMDAIEHLPPSGGHIKILPGEYREQLLLDGRSDVTVSGCGKASQLYTPPGSNGPVLTVRNCKQVKVKSLVIQADAGIGVRIEQVGKSAVSHHITLSKLEIHAKARSAVECRGGRYIKLVKNKIRIDPLDQPMTAASSDGKSPAVYLQADDVVFRNNLVAVNASKGSSLTALGGIQVGGGSDRVKIYHNKISQGNGNGITLGSVHCVKRQYLSLALTDYSTFLTHTMRQVVWGGLSFDASGCIRLWPGKLPPLVPPGKRPDEPHIPISEGSLTNINIESNRIKNVGGDGIGIVEFFGDSSDAGLISTKWLHIEGNYIANCNRIERSENPAESSFQQGHGAIALGDNEHLIIRNNVIEKNGTNVRNPICGVFVLHGEGVDLEGNRIFSNGLPDERQSIPGHKGGIVIVNARPPVIQGASGIGIAHAVSALSAGYDTIPPQLNNLAKLISTQKRNSEGLPAVRLHGNLVVSPSGPALKVYGIGPMHVSSNRFVSEGYDPRSFDHSGTGKSELEKSIGNVATVGIVNLGRSLEDTQLLDDGDLPTASSSEDLSSVPTKIGTVEPIFTLQPGLALMNIWPTSEASSSLAKESTSDLAISPLFANVMAADSNPSLSPTVGGTATNSILSAKSAEDRYRLLGQPGLIATPPLIQTPPRHAIANGNVIFHDNQVELALRSESVPDDAQSVLIYSRDDVSVQGNEFDCSLGRADIFNNVSIKGWTVRVVGNRFKETVKKSKYSLTTYAKSMNTTCLNHGTHCFRVDGDSPRLVVDRDNHSLVELNDAYACRVCLSVNDMAAAGIQLLDPEGNSKSLHQAQQGFDGLTLAEGDSIVAPVQLSSIALSIAALTDGQLKVSALNAAKIALETRSISVTRGKEFTIEIHEPGIRFLQITSGQVLVTRICYEKQRTRFPKILVGTWNKPFVLFEEGLVQTMTAFLDITNIKLTSDERDANRLLDKLGPGAPEVTDATGKLLAASGLAREFLAEGQRSALSVAEVEEVAVDISVFEGRVVDSTGVGIPDVTVKATDPSGKPIGSIVTDSVGHYRFDVHENDVSKPSNSGAASKGPTIRTERESADIAGGAKKREVDVAIEVLASDKTILHRDKGTIKGRSGRRVAREIVVDRSAIIKEPPTKKV